MRPREDTVDLQSYFAKPPKVVLRLFLHDKEFTFFFGTASCSTARLLDYG
jgi:hypothetical protein